MSAGEEPYDCTSDEEDEGENNHGNEDEGENGETDDEEEHRPQWAEDFAARAAARHTFALVLHDAAGADSPANVLSQELVSAVLGFLPKRQKGSLLLCVGGMGGDHTSFGEGVGRGAREMRSLETFDLDAHKNEPTTWCRAPPLPLQAGKLFTCDARTAFCSLRDMFVVLCRGPSNGAPQLWAFSLRACSWRAIDWPAGLVEHGNQPAAYGFRGQGLVGQGRSRVPLLAGSGDRLYLAMGASPRLWCYDARTDAWTQSSYPEVAWTESNHRNPEGNRSALTHGAMAVVGDKVVIVGFGAVGWNDSPGLWPEEDRGVLQYDTQADTWTRLPALPAGLHVDAALSVGTAVVLLGWLGPTTESRTRFVEVALNTGAAKPEWRVSNRDTNRGYCGFNGAVSYGGSNGRGYEYAMAGGVRMDLSDEDNAQGFPSTVVYSRRAEVHCLPQQPSPSVQWQSWEDLKGRQTYCVLPHLSKSRFMCAVGVL